MKTRWCVGLLLALVILLSAVGYRAYHERQADHSQSLGQVQTRLAVEPTVTSIWR
jgi:hypothetical protein